MKKINGHGHLLPYPEEIPNFMKEKEIFWVSEDKQFMHQKNWSRPITDASFFLNEKLEWMARNKLDHEVVLNLAQIYGNGLEETLCGDAIRWQNNYNASLQADYPTKFTTGFVVQPAYPDQALREIERCVKELNLKLLCLPTHYLDKEKKWHSTAHESVDEIYQLANQYKLAIEIHPYDGPKMIGLANENWRFHLIWMCAQTADQYHEYTLRGLPDLYPNIRVCYAHGNQYAQVNIGRRKQGFDGRPDLFKGQKDPRDYVGHPNIFFDTLVHDPLSFDLLVKRQGASQIVVGLDDPYPLGEMESVPNCYPGKVIDQALEANYISKSEFKSIWKDNVLKWLG